MTKAFAMLSQTRAMRDVRVRWWQGDVGAIEVEIGRDEWMTVSAVESRWIGKDYSDVLERRERMKIAKADEDPAFFAAVLAIDTESLRLKALHKLAAPHRTPAEIEDLAEDFTRFTTTAERDFAPPQPRGLFADRVTGAGDPAGEHDSGATTSRGGKTSRGLIPLDKHVD